MVNEIVLAIDPALRKIEEILLWKHKLKTILVFSGVHLVFWLFIIYNIRTYCILFCTLLFLHMLDAYRTKKRRELLKLRNQSNEKIIENISSLGRYIIYVHAKFMLLWVSLRRLKEKNRLQYFLVLLLFWSMLTVIGIKIKGLYLSYMLFWIVFFVPAILHYELPKKLLHKALPLLQQLDQSMKYERRSVLDKSELLVDVRLPDTSKDDELEEEEYLKAFKFDESESKLLENLDDGEEDEVGDYVDDNEEIEYDEDEMASTQQQQQQQPQRRRSRTIDVDDEDDSEQDDSQQNIYDDNYERQLDHEHDDDDDEGLNSFLPDKSLPNFNDVMDSSHLKQKKTRGGSNTSAGSSSSSSHKHTHDKVVRIHKIRNRPSLLEYYGEMNIKTNPQQQSLNQNNDPNPRDRYFENIDNSNTMKVRSNSTRRLQQNEQDIDETFDFLDEELKKY